MSRLIHIWIDDDVDNTLLDNNYTDMVGYYKGDGDLAKMDCFYQGYETTVYFYTSEQVNNNCNIYFGGMELQKVIINTSIKEKHLLYLTSRMRSEILPVEGIYPTEEKFVMEIGEKWSVLDVHKGGNYREFRSFKDVNSEKEFLGLVREMGCPLDK